MTGRGRPRIGAPIMVRLTDAQLAEVDALAEHNGINRAECIRRLIDVALQVADSARYVKG